MLPVHFNLKTTLSKRLCGDLVQQIAFLYASVHLNN